ncbi:hypothetical protein ACFPRL_17210 [Pseudoclavibacter helvolus]
MPGRRTAALRNGFIEDCSVLILCASHRPVRCSCSVLCSQR